MQPNSNLHNKINWIEIALFYILAVAVSLPFRLNLVNLNQLCPLPAGLNVFYAVFKALGPLAGFLILFYLLKTKTVQQNTLFGKDKKRSLLAISVIPVLMTILGVNNEAGLNSHYYGFIYAFSYCIYALFEEYGWRGYLQPALEPMKMIFRVPLIAILWFLWHLNFLLPIMTLQQHIFHFLFILLGTWGLLQITNRTHSLLFASAVHLSFNLFTEVNGEFNKRIIIVLVAVFTWTLLLKAYNKDDSSMLKANPNLQQL